MIPNPIRTVAAGLLAAALACPQDPAPRAPTRYLPAGDHSVVELLQHAELAVKRPIRARLDDEALAGARVALQQDLELPAGEWQDVLGALLSTRGVTLARSEDGAGWEALPRPAGMAPWIESRAEAMTPAALFARPAMAGPVRVDVTTAADTALLAGSLRPFLAGQRAALAVERLDGGVRLVGLADDVRFAVAHLGRLAPDVAAAVPAAGPRPWPRESRDVTHRLEPGTHGVRALVDLLAVRLGRNVVEAPDLAACDAVDVAAEVVGDDLRFEEQLSALLWQRRVLVLPVSARHGLYEAVLFEPGDEPPAARVTEVTPAELLARPALVAWVATSPDVGTLSQQDVVGALRKPIGAGPGRSTLAVGAVPGSVFFTGLSCDVVPALQLVDSLRRGR